MCFAICRFSRMVFIPRAQPHAQSLFLFPIVFGINCNTNGPIHWLHKNLTFLVQAGWGIFVFFDWNIFDHDQLNCSASNLTIAVLVVLKNGDGVGRRSEVQKNKPKMAPNFMCQPTASKSYQNNHKSFVVLHSFPKSKNIKSPSCCCSKR